MIDPVLIKIFITSASFGACGALVAVVLRAWGVWRHKDEGSRIDQSAAIGFMIGASWGAFHAIFQSIISR